MDIGITIGKEIVQKIFNLKGDKPEGHCDVQLRILTEENEGIPVQEVR